MMRRFARLYAELDQTTRTSAKVEAMAAYFGEAPPEDAAWAIYFLSGRRIKRLISGRKLRGWAAEAVAIPEWLAEECHGSVGDSAEAAALLLSGLDAPEDRVLPSDEPEILDGERSDGRPLHHWVGEEIVPLRGLDEAAQRDRVLRAWSELDGQQRFIFNKLITGAFRVGVSQKLLTRALAAASGIDEAAVAHRLMGTWEPTPAFVTALLDPETDDADISRPYPFYLAYALEPEDEASAWLAENLGDPSDWCAEWKWDGIRAQVVRRGGDTFIWSRGEELVTERFPEVAEAAALLPDGLVLDGELLAWKEGGVLPFAQLQRRIGRKAPSPKMQRDVPVSLLAFDVIEYEGEDVRERPFAERRNLLTQVAAGDGAHGSAIHLSPLISFDTWDGLAGVREQSREHQVEGLMLKRSDSVYRVGRRRGEWWKWKIDPLTIDAVLLYAQRGSGRRASLYTDYTFGIWDDAGELVPFAKAYSGLTDDELRSITNWVRRNTEETFGPVRSVARELVFELAFEGIQESTRHKSGVAVRFPRIVRQRTDKRPEDADTLATIRAMLAERDNGGK